jgi:hypothetical protein
MRAALCAFNRHQLNQFAGNIAPPKHRINEEEFRKRDIPGAPDRSLGETDHDEGFRLSPNDVFHPLLIFVTT